MENTVPSQLLTCSKITKVTIIDCQNREQAEIWSHECFVLNIVTWCISERSGYFLGAQLTIVARHVLK
jgi:hypothetical protein